MNYPVWYLPETGGGLLVALIAVLHVFVSHFAVGGGLYLIYAEKKGLREGNRKIIDFTHRHARFFLLVTMVFGSITGVGIWFIIALVNPAATSFLIHNFVFGWAAEWVFFVVEIAAAFVYYYTFGKMDSATHLKVGWLYFFAAWMSLFLINGIIGVMLTPGNWAADMNFWVGFFNPSFWPSLVFRTCIALMIAGCYGYLSASFTVDHEVRASMTRFSAKWALASLAVALPAGLWYVSILPVQPHALVMGESPTISAILPWGGISILLLTVTMLGTGIVRPSFNVRPMAIMVMASALAIMGTFEWTREAARRPFIINGIVYSNSIFKKDVTRLNQKGYLKTALWVENKEISETNIVDAGQELFMHQCYSCHTAGGKNNDIIKATEKMSFRALSKYIERIHTVRYFMPPFAGTENEARALAAYISGGLHGKDISEFENNAGVEDVSTGGGLFEEHCSSCHGSEDIAHVFQDMSEVEIIAMLGSLDEISDEMQPFDGSKEEFEQLAEYLQAVSQKAAQADGSDGRAVFQNHCQMCHGLPDLIRKTATRDRSEILLLLGRLDQVQKAMPPFRGTALEKEVLADFLSSLKQGGR